MDFAKWDMLFNLLLLFFWFGVWNTDDREAVFNPYLGALSRASNAATNFLRPVLAGFGARAISLSAFLFLLVFRGLAIPAGAQWSLSMGFETGHADPARAWDSIAFSALSFSIVLFKLWGLAVIYVHARRGESASQELRALDRLALPFNAARAEMRPLILLAWGVLIGWLIHFVADDPGRALATSLPGLAVSALAAWVSVLPAITQMLWLLIIGSWVAMFTSAPAVAAFCHNWLNLFLGPLRRYPVRIGAIDISPILFVVAVGAIHRFLFGLLSASYRVWS